MLCCCWTSQMRSCLLHTRAPRSSAGSMDLEGGVVPNTGGVIVAQRDNGDNIWSKRRMGHHGIRSDHTAFLDKFLALRSRRAKQSRLSKTRAPLATGVPHRETPRLRANPPPPNAKTLSYSAPSGRVWHLAVRDMRYSAIFLHMHVESVLVKVLSHHLAGLDDPVLLGERLLREELQDLVSVVWIQPPQSLCQLTVSLESSPSWIFLPTSLLVHSSVLSPDWLVIPGTTRGMLLGLRMHCSCLEYFSLGCCC